MGFFIFNKNIFFFEMIQLRHKGLEDIHRKVKIPKTFFVYKLCGLCGKIRSIFCRLASSPINLSSPSHWQAYARITLLFRYTI